MSDDRRKLAALIASGGAIVVLIAAGLYEQAQDNMPAFVAIALAQGALYLLAVWLVWRGGLSRTGFAVILATALLMRISVLWFPPGLSTDVYRYVWDGRVQGAGINPYRYIPADPHLNELRDSVIFPNVNRSTYAPTIYPPVAETIFFTVTRFGQSVIAMKAAMVVFEAVTIVLLLRLLSLSALPPERILVYAWHPLTLWEFAGNGHIDAAMITFVALALWARRREMAWLTGIAASGAVLVKFFPAVIVPALYRRWDWKVPVAFVATAILAYLPFLGAGWKVLGFLSGYAYEEGFNKSGAGYYLWALAKTILPLEGISALPYIAFSAAIVAAFALAIVFAKRHSDGYLAHAAILASAFVVLLSPHYPWYFTWLITFSCFVRYLSLRYLTVASFLLYLVPVGSLIVADTKRLIVESVIYGPFAVLVLCDVWLQSRRPLDRS